MQEEEGPSHDLLAPHVPAMSDIGDKLLDVAAGETAGEHQLELALATADAECLERLEAAKTAEGSPPGVTFLQYESELQLPHIMRLMKADLSEPYSIYTYRYFIHNWPNLCFLVRCWGTSGTYTHTHTAATLCTNHPYCPL